MGWWDEDSYTPRVDHAKSGASPHQTELRPRHPQWFRKGDIVRIGVDRLVGTGKFYYRREYTLALNEAVQVQEVRDDGVLIIKRGVDLRPAQPIKRGDMLYIIGSA